MKRQRGFTLIELAIVLVIITILIGGLAVPLSTQIQARRIAETRKTLEDARDALFGYAMTHPVGGTGALYLPCPDTDGDGRENRLSSTQCAAYHGWFPWADLGAAAQDAWGNRLRYAVIPNFIDRSVGFSATVPAPGMFDPLKVCSTRSCPSPLVADNGVFVLVSYGPNGWGALNVGGSTLAAPTGLDEAENLDTVNRIYVSRPPTGADNANGEFDDLLTWVSQSQLVARVCPTGCSAP